MKRLLLAGAALLLLLSFPAFAQSTQKLGGWLLREGHKLDLNLQNVVVKATSCREPELPQVTITLLRAPNAPATAGEAPAGDPLLCITADTTRVKDGEVMLPETALDVECSTGRATPVQVHAYTSGLLRGPDATLARLAWVQFVTLKREGPIDVRFEADFERFGRVTGHLLISRTEVITGRVSPPKQ